MTKSELNGYKEVIDIHSIITLSLFVLAILALWQHLNINIAARQLSIKECEKREVVLLDQTIVLKKMKIVRVQQTLCAIERQYTFEFSRIGDARYQGELSFIGKRPKNIDFGLYRME